MEAVLRGYVVQTIAPAEDRETGSVIVLEGVDERPTLTRVWGYMDAPGAEELMEAGLFDEVTIECNVREGTWRDSGAPKVDVKWSLIKLQAAPAPKEPAKS